MLADVTRRGPCNAGFIAGRGVGVQHGLQVPFGSDLHAQPDFVRGLKQLHPADFFQIQTDRVPGRIKESGLQVFILKASQRVAFDFLPVASDSSLAGIAGRERGRCGPGSNGHRVHSGSLLLRGCHVKRRFAVV